MNTKRGKRNSLRKIKKIKKNKSKYSKYSKRIYRKKNMVVPPAVPAPPHFLMLMRQ